MIISYVNVMTKWVKASIRTVWEVLKIPSLYSNTFKTRTDNSYDVS